MMISVQEARCRIIAPLRPLGAELVSLREAEGRVLASDLAARLAHPQVAIAAMDGYAVRAADLVHRPVTLTVVGRSEAGDPAGWCRRIGPGEAVRVFTGAAVPDEADAIVLQEDTEAGSAEAVIVRRGVTIVDSHIRLAGLDFKIGDVLLRAGQRLTFRDIALAAAMNVPWLSVVRRPQVAILSTGNEVRLPGETLGPTDLIDSNGFALAAFVTSHGSMAIDLGVARDNRASLLALAGAARGVDLLITSGGISVGDCDLVREALGEAGLALDFWKVAVQPGKPLMSGYLAGVPVISLPGNPVSAMVSAILFVLPALNALLGLPVESGIERLTGVLACDLPANDSREQYLRAIWTRTADSVIHIIPFAQQDSAMLAIFVAANCLAIRPPHALPARMGDTIEIIVL